MLGSFKFIGSDFDNYPIYKDRFKSIRFEELEIDLSDVELIEEE